MVPKGVDPIDRLRAVAGRLPVVAAFTGQTSVWLHGVDLDPCDPIEVVVPPEAGVSARSGAVVRRSRLDKSDVVQRRGLPATWLVRAVADACSSRTLTEAVVVADAALHKGEISIDDLRSWVDSNSRRHGIRRLRQVIELAEPLSESPMESRLRMLLVLGGLPRPRAQVSLGGRRVDLYYEDERLGIDYDGASHRVSFEADLQRQNELLLLGIRLLRFSGRDVLGDPNSVLRNVRGMVGATSAGRNRPNRASGRVSAGRNAV